MNDERSGQGFSEEELLEFARQGDRQAFGLLVDAQLPRIWRIVWSVLLRDASTVEVVRSVFLAAHRTLPAYTGDIPFATWLARIAVLRALKALERVGEPPRTAAGPAPASIVQLTDSELAERLRERRSTIPGGQRAVLVLREVERFGWEDVEAILGLPTNAARARLARARLGLWRSVSGAPDGERLDKRVEELLSGYIDDDLEAGERAEAEQEIAARPAAAALLEDLKRLRAAGAKGDEPPPPPDLAARIRGELPAGEATVALPAKPRRPARRSGLRRGPVLWAVAGVIVVGGVAAGVYFAVQQGIGADTWRKIHAHFTPRPTITADEPPAQPPAAPTGAADLSRPGTAPAESAPAQQSETAPSGATPLTTNAEQAPAESPAGPTAAPSSAATAPTTEGAKAPEARPPEPAAPAASQLAPTASTSTPPANAGLAAATPKSPPPEAQRPQPTAAPAAGPASPTPPTPQPAAVPPQQPSSAPAAAPGAAAPATSGVCSSIWSPSARPVLRWPAGPPPDASRRLGKLALELGGRGMLQQGDPLRVRMTVPRERWAALLEGLRKEGVAAPDLGAPPATADCAALLVETRPAP